MAEDIIQNLNTDIKDVEDFKKEIQKNYFQKIKYYAIAKNPYIYIYGFFAVNESF